MSSSQRRGYEEGPSTVAKIVYPVKRKPSAVTHCSAPFGMSLGADLPVTRCQQLGPHVACHVLPLGKVVMLRRRRPVVSAKSTSVISVRK